MDTTRLDRRLVPKLVGYVLLPSAVLGVGLWGEDIRPAILDLSVLELPPAAAIAVLGALAGAIFIRMPMGGAEEEPALQSTDERDEGSPPQPTDEGDGTLLERFGILALGGIALLAGAIASVTGEFNTYTVLFWICVPYGVGIASISALFRTERPEDGSTPQ
ncbi:hypothetical protein SVXHr_0423 [Halorhabdus sp. SVX81]|uniref:hypothetical protein n=1 Tax=Halorhabdus sp. SVX81 TaxID=2978283 RepID=UPI0023DC51DB|nr:hypothetical protein [Halorhabdus sp. SVX81]WEL16604.1 hypothetical protein SVXHr_0423 [Halorhabdus sp. SVX81]